LSGHGAEGEKSATRGWFIWWVWSIWFVLFIAQGNLIDQRNQTNKTD